MIGLFFAFVFIDYGFVEANGTKEDKFSLLFAILFLWPIFLLAACAYKIGDGAEKLYDFISKKDKLNPPEKTKEN